MIYSGARPKNKILVDGVDIADRFDIFMSDNYSLGLPTPKTYSVDIPGSGSIDLTDAMFGDVAYNNRAQEFGFYMVGDYEDYSTRLTKIANFLQGKKFKYQITMDLPYTYTGRFTVEGNQHTPGYYIDRGPSDICGTFKIKIDAEPWKLREKKSYSLNACGGKRYRFDSGRKPVRPVVEVAQPTTFVWKDKVIEVPQGTFRLNDVLFTEGQNDLYINSFPLQTVKWEDLGEGGGFAMTWDQARSYYWDEIHRLRTEGDVRYQSWSELSPLRWEALSDKTWDDLNYVPDTGTGQVYLVYDWEDL